MSAMTARRITAASFGTLWGATIIAGVFWLQIGHPERGRPWLAAIIGAEPVHIVAHVILYGTLACAMRRATRRAWVAFALMACFAILQEAAQSLWWGRAFGPGEFFDLGVDGAAAAAVLVFVARRERRVEA